MTSTPAYRADAEGEIDAFETDPQLAWTTWEGWRQFVEEPSSVPNFVPPQRGRTEPASQPGSRSGSHGSPTPPGQGDLRDLDAVLEEPRTRYHRDLLAVGTPMMHQVTRAGRRLVILNRGQRSARRGLIVNGDGGTGKTTAITHLGKTHELALRRRHPDLERGGPHIPVVYVTVPSSCTARMLAVEMARFLGLPVRRSNNLTDITESVCAVLTDTGCELVLIDEVHNIALNTRVGAEVSDHLKYFTERLPATFVYAGIDLDRTGLLAGTRGRQLASRFTRINTGAFERATTTQRAQWQALVTAMESTLRLHHHRGGSLPRLSKYLHDRTGGAIGSLSHLIRQAAIDAIISGAEQITRAGLEQVDLDHAATTHQDTIRHPRPAADRPASARRSARSSARR